MTEIDAINQRLNGTDERLNQGDETFAQIADALSRIAVHLQDPDATLAQAGLRPVAGVCCLPPQQSVRPTPRVAR